MGLLLSHRVDGDQRRNAVLDPLRLCSLVLVEGGLGPGLGRLGAIGHFGCYG